MCSGFESDLGKHDVFLLQVGGVVREVVHPVLELHRHTHTCTQDTHNKHTHRIDQKQRSTRIGGIAPR